MLLMVNGETIWANSLARLKSILRENTLSEFTIAEPAAGTNTLTDLSSGRSLDVLRDFDAGEPAPKTRDGYPYITNLITRANSKLLVAQYHVDLHGGEECRERAFVFDGDKITTISKTRRACTRY